MSRVIQWRGWKRHGERRGCRDLTSEVVEEVEASSFEISSSGRCLASQGSSQEQGLTVVLVVSDFQALQR